MTHVLRVSFDVLGGPQLLLGLLELLDVDAVDAVSGTVRAHIRVLDAVDVDIERVLEALDPLHLVVSALQLVALQRALALTAVKRRVHFELVLAHGAGVPLLRLVRHRVARDPVLAVGLGLEGRDVALVAQCVYVRVFLEAVIGPDCSVAVDLGSLCRSRLSCNRAAPVAACP